MTGINRRSTHSLIQLGFALVLLFATAATADDRDLLGSTGTEPYVFVLFDVSGSMNWQPGGDAFAPANGDDPAGKFYQAKSAVFEVLTDPGLKNIQWGFATYNQDNVRAYRKHWLYSPVTNPSWVTDGTMPYPQIGDLKYFGDMCMNNGGGCTLDGNTTAGSCTSIRDLEDPEEAGELMVYPVLGDTGFTTTYQWVRSAGVRRRLRFQLSSGNLGDDSIQVELQLREADDPCQFFVGAIRTETIEFQRSYTADEDGLPLAGSMDFLAWQRDGDVDDAGNPAGFFSMFDNTSNNWCGGAGWESNTDTGSDDSGGVLLKYRTSSDPLNRHPSALDRGDVIPLDWRSEEAWGGLGNRDAILQRMAPNWTSTGSADPDFRVGVYLEDHPDTLTGGRLALLSQFTDTPPLLPNGATPIGSSMEDFMDWYDAWKPVASDPVSGDLDFTCRDVNLLIITDGDETCYSGNQDGQRDGDGDANPCWIADRLFTENNRNIKTYVVGFGVPGADANFLNCIADNGGTGINDPNDPNDDGPGPILPANKQELVDALKEVIRSIRSDAASFASAAVPSAQAEIDDAIFLSEFIPIPDASVWAGHVDAFLRPLPLDVDGRPDDTLKCTTDVRSGCHLWDAAEELLLQAPTATDILGGDYRIGTGADQRRVYYSAGNILGNPNDRRVFQQPADDLDRFDLWRGLGILAENAIDPDPSTQEYLDLVDRSQAIIDFTLQQKTGEIVTADGPLTITYVLGDVFHSNPTFTSGPRRTEYFIADLNSDGTACADGNPGYRCFTERHLFRRKMLFVGSNDGQVHAVDAGSFSGSIVDGAVDGDFSSGTGRELFSYFPRQTLPTVTFQAEDVRQEYSVDGTVRTDDVFIDPVFSLSPNPAEREWRSVLIGGLREGGKPGVGVTDASQTVVGRTGYYALDITQPDALDANYLPQTLGGTYVPSCLDGGTDCGTVPFPTILWEFSDTFDEDGNGLPDLGASWSRTNIGRVRICDGTNCDPTSNPNDLVDKFVAVFGGGIDPANPDQVGNWLYMLDIETGQTIYKRQLVGSAPSDVAAVDTDLDGYLDRVYVGTTAGIMYKIDIRTPAQLEDVTLPDGSIQPRILDALWEPFPVFDTEGRPLYFAPAVIFVAEKGRFALAFGTGEREDLWKTTNQTGRFFMVLDDDFTSMSPGLPRTAASYVEIPAVGSELGGTDVLLSPPPGFDAGWYIALGLEERVITTPFALSGITIFTSFNPESDLLACSQSGESRIFTVFTTSGNGALSIDGTPSRFWTVPAFVTDPYTEPSATKNVNADGDGTGGEGLSDDLVNVMETLQGLFPRECSFANLTINIKTVRSDTGVFFIAPVPVCLIEHNWKEF